MVVMIVDVKEVDHLLEGNKYIFYNKFNIKILFLNIFVSYSEKTFFKKIRTFDLCISSGVAGNRGGPAWSPNLLKEYLYRMSLIAKK